MKRIERHRNSMTVGKLTLNCVGLRHRKQSNSNHAPTVIENRYSVPFEDLDHAYAHNIFHKVLKEST